MGASSSEVVRHFDDVVGDFAHGFVALGDHRHHDAFARLDFLDIREGLLVEHAALVARRIVRGQHHHRQLLVDQGVGPVLHLAGRISLGVDVGDLLQLERAFESDGEMHAAAQEEEIGGVVQLAAQRLVHRVVREHAFPACRECAAAPAPGSARRSHPGCPFA